MEENNLLKDGLTIRLKDYLKVLKDKNTYNKLNLLNDIASVYFHIDDKATAFRRLQQHLGEFYLCDPGILIDYLQLPIWIHESEVEKDFDKGIKHINSMKIKYGLLIREYRECWKSPFLINTVEANVENNESIHNITIGRADGISIKGQFKPQSILPIIQMLMSSAQMAIDKGVYNLNRELIENYIKTSSEFNEFLTKLIE